MVTIKLDITHNLCPQQRWAELSFDASLPLQEIRRKICHHVGSNENFVELLWTSATTPNGPENQGALNDLKKSLGDYGVQSGAAIHVIDRDPDSFWKGMQGQVETVPHYRLSDEAYAKKKGTAREFLEQLKKDKPELFEKKAGEVDEDLVVSTEAKDYLGQRCQIKETKMRGVVLWVGFPSPTIRERFKLPEKETIVGIHLDQPIGNFDGEALFTSEFKRGILVPFGRVDVGSNFTPLNETEVDEI